MLRVDPVTPSLSASEQFGLDVLVDLSRLLPTTDARAVALRVFNDDERVTPNTAARDRWRMRVSDGVVAIPRSLLALTTEVVGAVREQRSEESDRFDRVPPNENAMVFDGSERAPLVSQLAVALRNAAVSAAMQRPMHLLAPWPEGKRWAAAMTHDLDVVAAWPAFAAMRAGELLKKGEFGAVLRVTASAGAAIFRRPVLDAVKRLLGVEREFGIHSTWFIIAGSPTISSIRAGDITYTPESPPTRRILDAVRADGHEIGLHGSFATFTTASIFASQRDRLCSIAGTPVQGVRQHFLRMRPGATQRAMTDCGFAYDSTFGFADRNGFRLGVADVVPAWDDAAQRVLPLDEVPFIWMDRALSKYRGIEDPSAWVEDALTLAKSCREVDGVWTGIWHPNLAPALGFPGTHEAFAALVSGLAGHSPWFASLDDIARWRRARRAARAAGIRPDGTVELSAPMDAKLGLEDASAKPQRFVRA